MELTALVSDLVWGDTKTIDEKTHEWIDSLQEGDSLKLALSISDVRSLGQWDEISTGIDHGLSQVFAGDAFYVFSGRVVNIPPPDGRPLRPSSKPAPKSSTGARSIQLDCGLPLRANVPEFFLTGIDVGSMVWGEGALWADVAGLWLERNIQARLTKVDTGLISTVAGRPFNYRKIRFRVE